MAHHGRVTETTQPTAPPVPPARSRASQALGDMGRSLGLMAIVVAALLLLGPARTLVFPDDAEWQPVDYSSALRGFETITGNAPFVPRGLPEGWRANAGRVSAQDGGAALLHVGWAVSDDRFAGLDEFTGDWPDPLLEQLGVERVTTPPTTDVAGRTWSLLTSARGEPVLFRRTGDVTLVVSGDAGMAELRRLAGSLRPGV
jgi:hypothetical protein